MLGKIYLNGIHVHKNAENALYFLEKAASNGCYLAKLYMADMYFLGKDVNQNIKEALHLYIDATVCNYRHVKNNIGVIYNKGFNVVEKNTQLAQLYFRECIKSHNNKLSMYNLANIILDEAENKSEYPKEVELLIKSSENFDKSRILFCLLLWDKYKLIDTDIIENELMNYGNYSINFAREIFYTFMKNQNFEFSPKKNYELLKKMRNINYLLINSVETTTLEIENAQKIKKENIDNFNNKNINDDFFDGFGRPY